MSQKCQFWTLCILFLDLSTNARTKEEFLFKGCQARIRGYLAKAEAGIKDVNDVPLIRQIFTEFRTILKRNEYNGHYFDRSKRMSDTLCNHQGLFRCQGRFDHDSCKYEELIHSINPYESLEARIMFSTWNLDHVYVVLT